MRHWLTSVLLILSGWLYGQVPDGKVAFVGAASPQANYKFGPKRLPSGDILVAYEYQHVVSFSQQVTDFAIVCFASDGTERWSQFYSDYQYSSYLWSLAVSGSGRIYFSCYTNSGGNEVKFMTSDGIEEGSYYTGSSRGVMANASDGAIIYASTDGANVYVNRYQYGDPVTQLYYQVNRVPSQLFLDASDNIFLASRNTVDGWNMAKITSYGDLIWDRNYDDSPVGIQPDDPDKCDLNTNLNRVYVGASTSYNSYDDDLSVNAINATTGDILWVSRYNSSTSGYERARATAFDATGTVAVATETSASGGVFTSLVVVSPAGQQLWTTELRSPLSTGSCQPESLQFDGSGNLYVCGSIDLPGTRGDAFVSKYSPTGQQIWMFTYDNSSHGRDRGLSLDILPNGDIGFWLAERPVTTYDLAYLKIKQATMILSPASVIGSQTAVLSISLNSAVATSKTFILSSSSNLATLPSQLTIGTGSTANTALVNTLRTAATVQAVISASIGNVVLTSTLTVRPPTLSSLSLPATLIGGSVGSGTVAISGPAPQSGILISMYEGSPYIDAPGSVFIPSNQSSATFTFGTTAVSVEKNLSMTAIQGGTYTSATIRLLRPSLVSLQVPASGYGGLSVPISVTLDVAAPSAGLNVAISDNSVRVTTPNAVVPGGSTTKTVSATTMVVTTSTNVTFTASLFGITKTSNFVMLPVAITAFQVSPSVVFGGFPTTGIIVMSSPAPVGGAVVSLSSADPATVIVPATVTIPSGASSVSFMILTRAVSTSKVVATQATFGAASYQASITVLPVP